MTDRDPFAVRGFDENLALFRRGRRRLRPTEFLRTRRQLPAHSLQAIHVLRHAQDHLHDPRHLARGLLGRHQLIPALQPVAELAVGKLQPRVQRHGLQLWSFPRTVNDALERELAENRDEWPGARYRKPLHLATAWQRQLFPHVPRALEREKMTIQLPPQPPQLPQQLLLDHIRRGAFPRSLFHQLEQPIHRRLHRRLGFRHFLCHHVLEPPCQTRNQRDPSSLTTRGSFHKPQSPPPNSAC